MSLQGVNANGTLEALLPPLVPPPRNITRELHTSKSLIAGLAINGKEKFADDGETNVQDMAESDASRCILKVGEALCRACLGNQKRCGSFLEIHRFFFFLFGVCLCLYNFRSQRESKARFLIWNLTCIVLDLGV